ncbi:OadG family protein [uncultured Clostridium sp.]|uniref:OadG family protein n=1 Tax=uncultured Clostridium sp. TaxID=59620 RepID=UPI0025FD5827|nr:OadG family protein [uncultured Clostridium sp.]
MWTESTMPFGQSVIVSLLGLAVVFITLVTLALSIILISKILRTIIKDGAQKPAVVAAPVVSDETDKETLAVLMATIGMDLELPAEQFKIVNVKEL